MANAQIRLHIDAFGRPALLEAARLAGCGASAEAIAGCLSIKRFEVAGCIAAGERLREIASEQRQFENAIVEPC